MNSNRSKTTCSRFYRVAYCLIGELRVLLDVRMIRLLSTKTNINKLNLWDALLYAAKKDIAARRVFDISSLITLFSKIKNNVKSVLLTDLLLMRDCWHFLLRIWSWSLFLKSNIFSQWLQEDLPHIIIWL